MPVVELSIDSSGATTGLNKYDAAVNKSASTTDSAFGKMRVGVSSVGAAFAGIAIAGVAAATTAFVAFTVALAGAGAKAKEIENLARLAGEGVVNFQNLAYAADQYGFSAEKLADASKDIKEKIGDFITTGAGPMVDFFEQVAPKVGLTAEAMKELSGPEALQAVKNGMDELGLSAAEQSFHLETIGSDLTLLMPLLAENGRLWREGAAHADALGIALSKIQTTNLKAGAKALSDMTKMVVALKDKIVANLAPAFTLMVKAITDGFKETGLTLDIIAETIADKILDGIVQTVEVVRFLHNGFMGVHLVLLGMVVAIGEIIGAWGELTGHISALLDKIGVDNPFKQMGKDAVLFKESAREAFTEQLKKIEEVNKSYDKVKDKVVEVVEATKKLTKETGEVAEKADEVKDKVVATDTKEKVLEKSVRATTAAVQQQATAQSKMTDEVDKTAQAYEKANAAAAEEDKPFTGKYNKDGSESTGNWDMRGGSTMTASVSAHGNSLTDEEWAALPEWQKDTLLQATKPKTEYYYHSQGSGHFKGGVDQEANAALMSGMFQDMNKTTNAHDARVAGAVSNTFNFTESVSRSDIESIMQDATRIEERA